MLHVSSYMVQVKSLSVATINQDELVFLHWKTREALNHPSSPQAKKYDMPGTEHPQHTDSIRPSWEHISQSQVLLRELPANGYLTLKPRMI